MAIHYAACRILTTGRAYVALRKYSSAALEVRDCSGVFGVFFMSGFPNLAAASFSSGTTPPSFSLRER